MVMVVVATMARVRMLAAAIALGAPVCSAVVLHVVQGLRHVIVAVVAETDSTRESLRRSSSSSSSAKRRQSG